MTTEINPTDLLLASQADDVPVRLEAIAAYLRVYVTSRRNRQQQALGMRLTTSDGRFELELNAALKVPERRIVCAEALARIALGMAALELSAAQLEHTRKFALELLLPAHQLLPVSRDWFGREEGDAMATLARAFKVTPQAVRERLDDLEGHLTVQSSAALNGAEQTSLPAPNQT